MIIDRSATLYKPETWSRNGVPIDNGEFIHRTQMKFGGLSVSSTAAHMLDAQPGTGAYLQVGTGSGAITGIYQANNDGITEAELKICGAPQGKEK